MREKYIELLLNRCVNFDKSNSLFINYDKINKDFVMDVVKSANYRGITDIYLDEDDIFKTKEKLSTLSVEEIENDSYFDKSIWDKYAEKDATFIMFDSEFPGVMDDVDPKKITLAKKLNRESRPVFRKKEATMQISWCILALPNEIWARGLFPDSENAYEKLENLIYKCCMLYEDNPIEAWNKFLDKSTVLSNKLNSLNIKSLHYTNSLGTDLTLVMPKSSIWISAGNEGGNSIVNMPTYEIFSSPDYRKTSGIVYNALPLIYGGGIVDKFFIEFKDGKVVNYDAEIGKDILKGIIESDSNSCYLGECALVNNDSPISNTGVIFGTTLFDENASCHLALGDGFPECINATDLSEKELLERGINQSKNHVDFMIGTPDLEIEADTDKGKIKIFTNGNFSI